MWKCKWNKHKKFRDIRLNKPGLWNKNNPIMWDAAVSFSYFFYDGYISNDWMVSFKMWLSLIFLPSETEIELNNRLLSNKELIFRCLNTLTPFLCSTFFRWHHTFVICNLWVCWFMHLANHLIFLIFYKLTIRRCTWNNSLGCTIFLKYYISVL